MVTVDPVTRARRLCLDEEPSFGCAEATYAALQQHFELSNVGDSTEAMGLNGGIGYSGGTCGALTGAALSLGRLAGSRLPERPQSKRVARGLLQKLMADFVTEHGSTQCRDLTGFDLISDHDDFLASGIWETACQAQIEFVVERMAPLFDRQIWDSATAGFAAEDSVTPLETSVTSSIQPPVPGGTIHGPIPG